MVKELVVGTNYYFKIVIPPSQTDAPDTIVSMILSTNTKYRLNGGSWNTRTGSFIFAYDGNLESYKYNDGSWNTLTQGDIIEFVGTIQAIASSILNNNEWLFLKQLLLNSAIPNPIEIELDKMNCEPHLVSKTASTNLLYVDTAYGVFREEQNVLTPSIFIEYSKVPDFNYVYIPSLSRYYFVTSVTLVRYGIYRIDVKVDVLCTYDSDIRLQNCFVSRTASSSVLNNQKIDERLPLEKNPNVSIKSMTLATSVRIFEPFQNDKTIKNIALTIIGSSTLTQHAKTYNSPSTATKLPKVHSYLGLSPSFTTFAISLDDWKLICDDILADDSLATYIVSAVMYPFALNNDCNVGAGPITIKLGEHTTSASGYYMYGYISDYTRQFIHTFTERFSSEKYFLNYEPYTKYEMYVPYHGWLTLENKRILGKTIGLYYLHNYLTGTSLAMIYNETDDYLLDVYQLNVGTTLAITTTNARENQNQRDSATLNMVLGLTGSAIQMGTGAMSDKLGSVLGGGLSGAKAVMSKVNSDMYIYDKANTTLGSDLISNFTMMNGYIRETYYDTLIFDTSAFYDINGLKLDNYGTLTSLGCSGYTEIPEMHYVPSTYKFITKTEIDEIVSLAKNGIIL